VHQPAWSSQAPQIEASPGWLEHRLSRRQAWLSRTANRRCYRQTAPPSSKYCLPQMEPKWLRTRRGRPWELPGYPRLEQQLSQRAWCRTGWASLWVLQSQTQESRYCQTESLQVWQLRQTVPRQMKRPQFGQKAMCPSREPQWRAWLWCRRSQTNLLSDRLLMLRPQTTRPQSAVCLFHRLPVSRTRKGMRLNQRSRQTVRP
jgi:hypothetical protein